MSVILAIPSGTWTQLPGTEWEVYQESGEVAGLGAEDVSVRIRRARKMPTIGGVHDRPCHGQAELSPTYAVA